MNMNNILEFPSGNVVKPIAKQLLNAFFIVFLTSIVLTNYFLPYDLPVVVFVIEALALAISIVASTSCRNVFENSKNKDVDMEWHLFSQYHYARIKSNELNLRSYFKNIASEILRTKVRRLYIGPSIVLLLAIVNVFGAYSTDTSAMYVLALYAGIFSLGLAHASAQLVATAKKILSNN